MFKRHALRIQDFQKSYEGIYNPECISLAKQNVRSKRSSIGRTRDFVNQSKVIFINL
jgi:hypothetical protein